MVPTFVFSTWLTYYANAICSCFFCLQARQHGRQPAPPSPHPSSPLHPAPTGVRAYSCQHWESRLSAPPARPLSALVSEPHSPCDLVEVLPALYRCLCTSISMIRMLWVRSNNLRMLLSLEYSKLQYDDLVPALFLFLIAAEVKGFLKKYLPYPLNSNLRVGILFIPIPYHNTNLE